MKRSILILCVLAGCVADAPTESESAAAQAFRAEHTGKQPMAADGPDYCDIFDFYGDTICDTFCAQPDPDCDAQNECLKDSDCETGSECVAGDLCLFSCALGDPTCCTGNTCQPMNTAPEKTCTDNADCAGGEICDPGICLHWCTVDDPECCTQSSCQPVAENTPVDECLSSSDCADNEVCDPGICLDFCLPSEPGCCAPNTCEALPAAPAPSEDGNECLRDSDCVGDERCVPGELCTHWCLEGDPLCCIGNVCESP